MDNKTYENKMDKEPVDTKDGDKWFHGPKTTYYVKAKDIETFKHDYQVDEKWEIKDVE